MTQVSDSGDAAGDAGPTTDRNALWPSKVKIGLIGSAGTGKQLPGNYIADRALLRAVIDFAAS
jgi:hypothetical protein